MSRRWTVALGASCAIAFLSALIFPVMRVPSGSMEPGVRQGSLILVNTLPALLRRAIPSAWAPGYGDRVLFRLPDKRGLFFKRVVGMPGDRIEFRNGRLLRNGVRVQSSFPAIPEPPTYNWPLVGAAEDSGPIVVPPGCVFLLGDNRPTSLDSRIFGSVPQSDIVASFTGRLP